MVNEKQQVERINCKIEKPKCGIVMPISAIEDCSASHWEDVKKILCEAVDSAGYEANLVSNADDSGVIQKRIVQNLYDNEIVVCDVSCKNPNVMFELGMRLAFDKPTIIVIDDKTDYSFDTAPIEHLKYPRNLAYFEIVRFKQNLKDKIVGTVQAAKEPGYTTFLKNFGEFKIANIEHKEGSMDEAILSRINDLYVEIQGFKQYNTYDDDFFKNKNFILYNLIDSEIDKYCKKNNIKRSDLGKSKDDSEERMNLLAFILRNNQIQGLGTIAEIKNGIENVIFPF